MTAMIFPVKEIINYAKNNNIITIIDGAHVPGHIPLDILDLDPDYYTGACHKWMCTPKGVSFLYVKKEHQEIKTLIKSVDPHKSIAPKVAARRIAAYSPIGLPF